MTRRILRKVDAAAKLGTPITTFDDLRRRDGTFPAAILLGARAVGFDEAELDAWLDSRPRVKLAEPGAAHG